ncbi:transcription elongation factor GreA [candidate division WWE3 bacterium]|nr:transcription elongation factor GreA [candidate division WWE3 bacterium]
MSDTVYITKEGLEKLKKQLTELKEERRPAVAKRIKEAREMGDISENAEYDAARQEQAFIEGKISELEEVIKDAEVVEEGANGGDGVVRVGAKVTVHIEGEEETFHLVGAHEANPMENKISHESPLGASLMGKKVGDSFEVEAPIGKLIYKIKAVE